MALIKCPECGRDVSDRAVQCPHCGYPLNNHQNNTPTDETILMQGMCNRIKGRMNVQNGSAILTNKRFIYSKHSVTKLLAGGLLALLTKGSYEFDIPISELMAIEDSKHGFSKTLTLVLKNGESYEFYFSKLEEWKIHFNNLIA